MKLSLEIYTQNEGYQTSYPRHFKPHSSAQSQLFQPHNLLEAFEIVAKVTKHIIEVAKLNGYTDPTISSLITK